MATILLGLRILPRMKVSTYGSVLPPTVLVLTFHTAPLNTPLRRQGSDLGWSSHPRAGGANSPQLNIRAEGSEKAVRNWVRATTGGEPEGRTCARDAGPTTSEALHIQRQE